MMRTFSIKGFKSIYEEEISLGRVNCFIGANGVGKSNVLEALGVLSAAAQGIVDDESLQRRGVRAGLPRLYKSSFEHKAARPHIGLSVEDESQVGYSVSLLNPLESPKPAWTYKTESLRHGKEKLISSGVRGKVNLNPQAGLAALKRVEWGENHPATHFMDRLREYAIYCPNTPTLRGIAPDPQSRAPIGLNGGQLAEGFQGLRSNLEGKGEEGEAVLWEVLDLLDWASDVEATTRGGALLSASVPRSKVTLKFTDRFMQPSRNTLTAYDASEGALYVLFCAVLCLSPAAPQMFAIDNVDQALNPRLIQRLTQRLSGWLKFGGKDRQLLFTAHNPAVLDGLDLEDPEVRLFAVERNSEGRTKVNRITLDPALRTLHGEYPLSRLWMMGHLGAVPHV